MTTVGLLIITLLSYLVVSSCATTPAPPDNPNNICSIFRQYPKWYWSAKQARHQWKIPISTQMAIMCHESSFRGNVRPPREKVFGVIPWKHPTTAYGYSQALDYTWEVYERQTGKTGSNRNNFSDAIDFIAWYSHRAHVLANISNNDSYALYLAYHEGIGNYKRGTYRNKKWLIDVAHRVDRRARMYRTQLLHCEATLPRKPWWY
ncbi:MAG: transglycosylase SLT domain-containing protein [Gammaproteobacteria bacterium]|nr:transglycosylase SLT domain-containing protein [Gammaproteobacteria bacterium]